jgi:hypothetical protein
MAAPAGGGASKNEKSEKTPKGGEREREIERERERK